MTDSTHKTTSGEAGWQESSQPLPPGEPVIAKVLRLLQNQSRPLFALIDAAKSTEALDIARSGEERFRSLFSGRRGMDLAEFAPYLAALPGGSRLVKALLTDGWGAGCLTFLTSDASFKEVRRHLRRFLLVRGEAGQGLYFRYYNPRILRDFLPTLESGELTDFFGPIDSFLLEDVDPLCLLQFTIGAGQLRCARSALGEHADSQRQPPDV